MPSAGSFGADALPWSKEHPWMTRDCPQALPRSRLIAHQPPTEVLGRKTGGQPGSGGWPRRYGSSGHPSLRLQAEPTKEIREKTGSAPLPPRLPFPLFFPALLLGNSVCPAWNVCFQKNSKPKRFFFKHKK